MRAILEEAGGDIAMSAIGSKLTQLEVRYPQPLKKALAASSYVRIRDNNDVGLA
ncbi:MAG: hypothetical protein WA979_06830 [Pacificimonas sp.]